jgi:hypothetical protein
MSERNSIPTPIHADAFNRGHLDARFRRAPEFYRSADGVYDQMVSTIRGWTAVNVRVPVQDPAEAIAYLEGYEEGLRQ